MSYIKVCQFNVYLLKIFISKAHIAERTFWITRSVEKITTYLYLFITLLYMYLQGLPLWIDTKSEIFLSLTFFNACLRYQYFKTTGFLPYKNNKSLLNHAINPFGAPCMTYVDCIM